MAVASRTSFQTARAGWRPRKSSDARLARDIAESIRAHAGAGVVRMASEYTVRMEIVERVNALLDR